MARTRGIQRDSSAGPTANKQTNRSLSEYSTRSHHTVQPTYILYTLSYLPVLCNQPTLRETKLVHALVVLPSYSQLISVAL